MRRRGNNCSTGRPPTYAIAVAIITAVLLSLFCFTRRRSIVRMVQGNRPIPAPSSASQYPPPAGPPPPAFEPAPPYEPKPTEPIQYPPPSYAPGSKP
ncbi:hypothetical protein H0H87_000687 [Tephrocybe sp. NHM501043]|nr:hypothetical protein H0H87_000687 [Tephrocybe sp. NHM501043]